MTLQEFYENYRSMQEKCLENGRIIPVLISPETVPSEYKLSRKDMDDLDVDVEKLRESQRKRFAIEISIYNGENKEYGNLTEFYIDEFNGFLNDFPEFKGIFE